MRPAAIDLGTVRVGLAVADDLGLLAHPRTHLDGRDPGRLVEELTAIAQAEGIDLFLVGLPLRLGGQSGPEARRARRFAKELATRSGVRVDLVDERLTTREARSRLAEQGLRDRRARDRVDSAAAAVLLQSWLDARGRVP
jgi:putative holliday junction resolvase